MDLLSSFRRKAPAAKADRRGEGSNVGKPVEQARARARRRLIGAVVLLGAGIVAFPLLFETEPRPIPVDLPIEIPPRDGAPPLVMPGPVTAPSARVIEPPVVEPPVAEVPSAAPARPAVVPPPPPPQSPEPVVTSAPTPLPTAPTTDDGARAKALLEGRAASKTAAATAPAERYVVQVGAFAEARAVREVRAKIEGLGMPTYTQVVNVAAGERTRVRVGPFSGRDEADATAAKLKKAGFPAVVLTL